MRGGEYGLKTCLIEKDELLGGTCLHVGCIPTKALLFNAEIWEQRKDAKEFGIEGVTAPTLNWAARQQRKNKIVLKHAKGMEFLMRKSKVATVNGYGRLAGPAKDGVHTVEVFTEGGGGAAGETTFIKAKNILISTGSEARMLPGLEPDARILTNIEVLSLNAIPKSLIVIGAGAVGVEFASIYHSFGVDVTILEALLRLVPVEDEEVSKELLKAFTKRGIKSNVGVKVQKIEKTKDGVKVSYTDSEGKTQALEADKVLIAIGRAPRTDNIGPEKTEIKPDPGSIKTTEWLQTEAPGISPPRHIIPLLPHLLPQPLRP